MIIDRNSDYHVHTSFCHHATGRMEDYVLSAIAKGLHRICFLEHMEEGILTQRITWLTETDFDHYFNEGNRLKSKYSEKIEICLGVEVGYNPFHESKLLLRLAQRKWDHIGISCHFHYDQDRKKHLNLVSRSDNNVLHLSLEEANEIVRVYFTHLNRAVEVIPGNMVCHMDAVLRFHPQREEITLPWDLIEMLLRNIKQHKMAVEVNTSGIVMRNQIFPCQQIIARAVENKIPLIAGSDAHPPEDVGYAFTELENMINQ